MSRYTTLSDDHYVNINLTTEMDLPSNRESVLHFFEQVRKHFPAMENFYGRERGEFYLEEEKERGQYRWVSTEPRRLCAGHVNPESAEDAMRLHGQIMELAPYALSLSNLDCESLSVMYGFDFTYRGNHNQLLVDALGLSPAMESFADLQGATVINNEPSLRIALDEDCRTQCRLSFETRTSPFHIRSGDFPEEQISVYVTARRYGSLASDETFASLVRQLSDTVQNLLESHVIEQVLRPLQQTIAIK